VENNILCINSKPKVGLYTKMSNVAVCCQCNINCRGAHTVIYVFCMVFNKKKKEFTIKMKLPKYCIYISKFSPAFQHISGKFHC